MKTIKLVIWDLDETFWKGTLSEGSIDFIPENLRIVEMLTKRGIINSISSKNDFDAARARLEEAGVWEYFVFPKIGWNPKGPEIRMLIEQMQLRSENILFVDDNPMNLKEAAFYNPGLHTVAPEGLAELLPLAAFEGKDDSGMSRLAQYRILEQKAVAKTSANSNEDFLRQSNIKVILRKDPLDQIDRLVELINRSNQLNFTKVRVTREELEAHLKTPGVEACSISVVDSYGDYGVSGFYSREGDRLRHFLFSCRVLDMGVERWLYERLGNPRIEIVGEVAGELVGSRVDWITAVDSAEAAAVAASPKAQGRLRKTILKGGCDLDQLELYLGGRLDVATEFNYVSAAGLPVHTEHTEILRNARAGFPFGDVVGKVPFLDESAFKTRFFDKGYDVYIYSVLMDYTQGLYRYAHGDLVLPYGDINLDITNASLLEQLPEARRSKLPAEFLTWFGEDFRFIGGLDEERFIENLRWMHASIPPGALLIFLNGSEVAFDHPTEGDRSARHKALNAALDAFAAEQTNVKVCDVRKFVRTEEDITDNIRHYKRSKYRDIAAELLEIVSSHFGEELAKPSKKDLLSTIIAEGKARLLSKARKGISLVRRFGFSGGAGS